MRRIVIGLAALFLVAAACSEDSSTTSGTSGATGNTGSTVVAASAIECYQNNLDALYDSTALTIGTDNPAFQPWFAGTGTYGDWTAKPNSGTGNPASGEGFEGALAYQIAEKLSVASDQVNWTPVNFNESYKPGNRDYDFYLGQVSYSPERAQVVAFSDGYYDVNQAVVANKGTPAADATTIADLKPLKLGAQIGTTSYQYIVDNVQPDQEPAVFDRSVDVIQALNNGQIDAYVVDAPTAYVNVLIGQAENGVVVGQFPNNGEYFGMTFDKDSPLVECVNLAIKELTDDGTLAELQSKWLENLDYPVIK
ncbi:MAG TPA: ABC transporter substrate-binding protein [Actinomycetota bacterium]|jgi:polar amino acid transport system substrate-binding protein